MKKLDARRARLDRTIALQKIFQSIILLNDSIDETKDSLEMNQGSNMIEGICSDQGFLDEAGCPLRTIYTTDYLRWFLAPGIHDPLFQQDTLVRSDLNSIGRRISIRTLVLSQVGLVVLNLVRESLLGINFSLNH